MEHVRSQRPMFDRNGALAAGAIAENPRDRAQALAAEILSPAFCAWLDENWHIWERFLQLSDQMRLKGRKYYAARTVIEVMCWHYHLQDKTDKAFVHNNNWTPMLARLYNAYTGSDFFQTREHGGRVHGVENADRIAGEPPL